MPDKYAPAKFDLGYDAADRTRQTMEITPDGKLHITTDTDIRELAEENRAIRNEYSGTEKTGDMVRVARMPMATYLELCERGIVKDRERMKKWLKSDEALPFRTHWMKG